MKWGVWIPPWVAIKSSVCARFDCNELRAEPGRRYCEKHAKEYEEENAVSETQRVLRLSSVGKRS